MKPVYTKQSSQRVHGRLLDGTIHTSTNSYLDPIDIHHEIKHKNMVVSKNEDRIQSSELGKPMDIEWLKVAASPYDISPDIKDYLMVPVILFYANLPNRNGVGFVIEDLVSFYPEVGMPSYKTWRAKPVFVEHDNQNVEKAKGVVLDTTLRKQGNYWKLLAYLAVDRGKDIELANSISSRKITTYSMGAYVTDRECSVCKKTIGQCNHIIETQSDYDPKMTLLESEHGRKPQLAYQIGRLPMGFEVSVVETPAYVMADNDHIDMFDVDEVT